MTIDPNLQAPGNPAGAGLITGNHGQYITPPGQRARDGRFQIVGNPYDAVEHHTRDRPTSRFAPISGPNPIVGLGAGVRGPRQQQPQPQPQNPTSYAPQGHLSPHGAGTTNPYLSPSAFSTNVPRQPSDDFGIPPVPRTRGDGGQSTVRQVLRRPAPCPTNHVQVSPHPRVPTGMEAYGGAQIQRTNQEEQPHRQGDNPNATLAYGQSTLNTSSTYGQPSIYGQPSPYDPFAAYGSSAAYGSFGVNHSAMTYGFASVPTPSEHGLSNNGATSAHRSFPAYESLQSRIDRGLPPHLLGPESLVPPGPVNRQNLEYPSIPTNAGADNEPRRGHGQYQPAAIITGTNAPRVTQGTYKLL